MRTDILYRNIYTKQIAIDIQQSRRSPIMKHISLILSSCFLLSNLALANVETQKNELKQQIIDLAKSFEGQGDPDYSRQEALEPLVEKLLKIAPQPPVEKRLPLLFGPWRQVWGPYDYRNEDRGIDPELGVEEIYQVISPNGYYYNVSYLYKNGDRIQKRIGLLRGEYRLQEKHSNKLKVRFTNFPGASSKPESLELWELAELAENGNLPNRIKIVPRFIVRLFFGGGTLREVYTDEDLRITYGSSKRNPSEEAIYIMTRVK